ncbi:hypothetical protein I0C86_15975 [Plantactinospora sp. S1510]|uniref:Prepilin type IV endopeptidase peptidase domain-containing protein n=1 Tax=Plantactinospora alkalitolerans TaxID=2789879 RepID=A0ABS0GW67_9ACTN|nr:hypothetical protein [Plantactinospora alkalitolerans]MBF9130445.1 hypothetical protein [Plantactinospora alkalitolerans]
MTVILVATLGALVAVLAVGVLVAIRKPADGQRFVRWSGLGITALVAATLAPFTIEDAGAAASYLLGVPVIAAALPLLAQRLPGRAGFVDLVAGAVIGGWGLLLALGGIGVAFLPPALLFVAAAAQALVPDRRPPADPTSTA